MTQQQQQKINVDLSQADDLTCSHSECNSNRFVVNYLIKKLSAIVSPNGSETLIPIQVFACALCGTIHDDFLPPVE